jgi:hypothetical protein
MATRNRTITRDVLSRASENPNTRPRVRIGARVINPGVSAGAVARALGNSPVNVSQSTMERMTGKRKSGRAGH